MTEATAASAMSVHPTTEKSNPSKTQADSKAKVGDVCGATTNCTKISSFLTCAINDTLHYIDCNLDGQLVKPWINGFSGY